MTRLRVAARLELARERWEQRALTWRRAVPSLDLAWEMGIRMRRRNVSVLAGHIAYRLFLFLAPLALVLIAGFGLAAAENIDVVELAQQAGATESAASEFAGQASRGRAAALAVGLPALVIATLGLVRGVHYAYAQVWAIEIRARKGLARSTAAALGGALVLAAIYFVIAAIQRQGALLAVTGSLGSLALTTAALWSISWVMPRATDRVIDLLPGPLAAALALSAIQFAMALYLPSRVQSASQVYGTIGVTIAILFYMYLIAYVLVLIPLVNSIWVDRGTILAGRPWVVDVDQLPPWFRRPVRWAMRTGSRRGDDATAAGDGDSSATGRQQ